MQSRATAVLRAVALSLALMAGALFAGPATAAVTLPDTMTDPPEPGRPTPVAMSLYLDDVSRIDINARNFAVTAQLVLEWRDPRIVPLLAGRTRPEEYEGAKVTEVLNRLWHPAFEISNEQNQRRVGVRALQLHPDGRIKLYEKFDSLPHLEGDMHLFPFVQAKLRIAFSAFLQDRGELETRSQRFEFQPGQTAETVIVDQWAFVSMTTEQKWERRSDEPDTLYSRTDFVVTVARESFSGFITYILPLMMLAIVSVPLLWLDPVRGGLNAASPRIGGTLLLVLTSVALQITQRARMPNVHYLTLTDYLFYLTLIMLTVSISLSCVLVHLIQRDRMHQAARLDHMVKVGYPAAFIALATAACIAASLRAG